MAAKFKITKDKRGEYRFKLNAPNGETIAVSEGYTTKSSAKKGIDIEATAEAVGGTFEVAAVPGAGTRVIVLIPAEPKAALREETKDLPDIRRGGLEGLRRRMVEGLQPDAGPPEVDPRYGAVLVGARGPLIAFNVWLDADVGVARTIAAAVRAPGKVRALGLEMDERRTLGKSVVRVR